MAKKPSTEYAELVGKRIKIVRHARMLTTRELASQLGLLSAGTISEYERGRTLPSVDILMRMSALLGVRPGWLLGEGLGKEQDVGIGGAYSEALPADTPKPSKKGHSRPLSPEAKHANREARAYRNLVGLLGEKRAQDLVARRHSKSAGAGAAVGGSEPTLSPPVTSGPLLSSESASEPSLPASASSATHGAKTLADYAAKAPEAPDASTIKSKRRVPSSVKPGKSKR